MSKSTDSMELGPRRPKHPAFQNLDPTTRFLYTPRTITGLFIGFLLVVYFSRTFNPPPAKNIPEQDAAVAYGNVKHGLIAMVMVWLGYSFLQGPTTCMVRPHPGLWRLVHGVLIVYLLGLVFLLFQNVDDARQLFRHLDPELGVQLPERAYGTDCRLHIPGKGINWEVIRATVCDEFVLAHTLGWWAEGSGPAKPPAAVDAEHRLRADGVDLPAHAAQLQRVLVGQLGVGRAALQLAGHLRRNADRPLVRLPRVQLVRAESAAQSAGEGEAVPAAVLALLLGRLRLAGDQLPRPPPALPPARPPLPPLRGQRILFEVHLVDTVTQPPQHVPPDSALLLGSALCEGVLHVHRERRVRRVYEAGALCLAGYGNCSGRNPNLHQVQQGHVPKPLARQGPGRLGTESLRLRSGVRPLVLPVLLPGVPPRCNVPGAAREGVLIAAALPSTAVS
eukprot:jgi/Botrbrau1/16323/Bobra.0066s0090.1